MLKNSSESHSKNVTNIKYQADAVLTVSVLFVPSSLETTQRKLIFFLFPPFLFNRYYLGRPYLRVCVHGPIVALFCN